MRVMSEPSKKDSPNLFKYATKELSQDAMICWLIDWAGRGKDAGPEQEELRNCGRRFVSALLNHKRDEKGTIALEDNVATEIYQQDRSIDVLARINRKHVLLIEDKTVTKDHGKQLSRYYNDLIEGRTQFRAVLERDIYPVYLKTGNQAVADDHRVEKIMKYKVFNRTDFLRVLNGYRGQHPILLDFRQYLREWEVQTNSYAEWTRDDARQSWRAWEGFYRCLEGGLNTAASRWNGWGHVPNRSGGFLGFWWWLPDNEKFYLQIEGGPSKEARLCFKVCAEGQPNDRQEEMKQYWHERVLAADKKRVVRPSVMRRGNYMTVAWWKDNWMAFDKDDNLDISGTVENLKQAEAVLKTAISSSS